MNTTLQHIATATRKIFEYQNEIQTSIDICNYHTELLTDSLQTKLDRYRRTTGILVLDIRYNPSDTSPMVVTIRPKRQAPLVKRTYTPQRDIVVEILYPMDAFVGRYQGKPYKTYKQIEKKLIALINTELGHAK